MTIHNKSDTPVSGVEQRLSSCTNPAGDNDKISIYPYIAERILRNKDNEVTNAFEII